MSSTKDSSQHPSRDERDTSFVNDPSSVPQSIVKDSEHASMMEGSRDVHPIHNVSIDLTGNYSMSISRKGNTKMSIDKDSLSGTLILDGGSKSEARLPMAIRKFRISKNLKRISYKASIQSEHLNGKVYGMLRFQNPIDLASAEDQALLPKPKSSLKLVVKEPQVTVKKGSRGKIEFNQLGQAIESS
jgi:hypothetical protein